MSQCEKLNDSSQCSKLLILWIKSNIGVHYKHVIIPNSINTQINAWTFQKNSFHALLDIFVCKFPSKNKQCNLRAKIQERLKFSITV